MPRKKKEKLKIERLEPPILPIVMAVLVIGALYLIIFSVNPYPTKTGLATEFPEKDVACLRKSIENSNIAVTSEDSCCFLIGNSDRCRPAAEDEPAAHYRGRTGDYQGYLDYDYACFGGSSERVFFTEDTRYYCGLEI